MTAKERTLSGEHSLSDERTLSDGRSIFTVLQDIVNNVQDIIRLEVRLAKTEVREELAKVQSAGLLLGIGATAAIFSVLFILLAIASALSRVVPDWAAALIVAIGVALIAAVTLAAGMKRFKTVQAAPKTTASLKENVTLDAFLPALEAYLRHLQAAGYVLRWHVERRQVLGTFDSGLPDFTHYIAIEFPDLDHDAACYQYVSGQTEPVHALHVAMYQQVQAGARFFLTYEPTSQ